MTSQEIHQKDLLAKLPSHVAWLNEKPEGEQLVIADSNLSDISISNNNFASAILIRCVITNATFINCNFRRVEFFDTVLHNCSFHACNLWRVQLNGANFTGVDFTGSNLIKADMNGSIGQYANFTDCDLGYAYIGDLRHANFENASFAWTHFGGSRLYNTHKFHIRSFDKATIAGDPVDISPNADGSLLIETLDELIAYLSI